ncbi:MAG: hypothetical protein OWQ59_07385 [Alicyclobacillaceae bacterium]|jgi:hypothetical protein|nr:hypothetical protein [Alicyclobacillaceae bacterium]
MQSEPFENSQTAYQDWLPAHSTAAEVRQLLQSGHCVVLDGHPQLVDPLLQMIASTIRNDPLVSAVEKERLLSRLSSRDAWPECRFVSKDSRRTLYRVSVSVQVDIHALQGAPHWATPK